MAALPDNPLARLRRGHVDQIVGVLTRSGPCSRADLARATGLSRTTLSTVAAGLLESGIVREIDATARAERGRPALMLALDPGVPVAIGVDFGHRRVRVSIAGSGRRTLATATRAHRVRTPWTDRVATAAELLETMLTDQKLPTRALEGIGIGIVGPVDRARAELARSEFGRRFAVPVFVDNNTRLAGLAETTLGAAPDAHVLYVRLSSGIGGAAVVGGELIHGASGAAAEIGHLCIDPDGPSCWCGGAGCLETYASVPAVLARCRPHRIRSVAALRRVADGPAAQLLRETGTILGIALAHAATILNPSRVVVGGELAVPVLLRAAEAEMRRRTMPTTHRDLTVDPATLSDEDGALGGICLVLTKAVER